MVTIHSWQVRDQYTDHQLNVIARLLKTRDSGHQEAVESFIVEVAPSCQ